MKALIVMTIFMMMANAVRADFDDQEQQNQQMLDHDDQAMRHNRHHNKRHNRQRQYREDQREYNENRLQQQNQQFIQNQNSGIRWQPIEPLPQQPNYWGR